MTQIENDPLPLFLVQPVPSHFSLSCLPPGLLIASEENIETAVQSESKRNPSCSLIAQINQAKQLLLLAQAKGGVCLCQEVYKGEIQVYDPGKRRQENTKTSLGTLKKSDHCC